MIQGTRPATEEELINFCKPILQDARLMALDYEITSDNENNPVLVIPLPKYLPDYIKNGAPFDKIKS